MRGFGTPIPVATALEGDVENGNQLAWDSYETTDDSCLPELHRCQIDRRHPAGTQGSSTRSCVGFLHQKVTD